MEYLTEIKLKEILDSSTFDFVYNKGLCKGVRYRPDFRCDDLMLIVEFDGYQHYSRTQTQINDQYKEQLYKDNGYYCIRIPYFIQLTSEVYNRLFVANGYDLEIDTSLLINYPHGFHDPNAMMPSDFNLKGLDRFLLEMSSTFRDEQYDVFNTVTDNLSILNRMIILDDPYKYVDGFIKSNFDSHGMLKTIAENYTN